MKKIICLLLVLTLNIIGCSNYNLGNLHNNDSDNNDIQIQNDTQDIQTSENDVYYHNVTLSDETFKLEDTENNISGLNDNDFVITDNIDTILGSKYSDFATQKVVISSSYVGEIRSENNIIYKFFHHSYDDFDLYTSNINYDIKNHNFEEYYISQLTIKSDRFKTSRGVTIGSCENDIFEKYGRSCLIDSSKNSLVYQCNEKK